MFARVTSYLDYTLHSVEMSKVAGQTLAWKKEDDYAEIGTER